MQKLLIADHSEEQRDSLTTVFQNNYDVYTCSDGLSAIQMLRTLKPHALIIDLQLSMLDGISVLRESLDVLPSVILATGVSIPIHIDHYTVELNIGHVIRKPCSPAAIGRHIAELERLASAPLTGNGARLNQYLQVLGVESHLEGFEQLRIGIPLYAQDPTQPIFKGLYANVAAICGKGNSSQVERTMRAAIQRAWKRRDEEIWSDFFGTLDGSVPCPTNKAFIAALAKRLA